MKTLFGHRPGFLMTVLAVVPFGLAIACAPAAAPTHIPVSSPAQTPTVHTPTPVPLGQSIILGPGESAVFSELGRVTFVRIEEDSRCPEDVTCIWAGQTVAVLTVGANEEARVVVSPGDADSGYIVRNGYRVTVKEVTPYPRSERTIDPSDYRVTLVVSELPTMEVQLGQQFKLAVGHGADVEGLGRLTFVRVQEDSRCPADAVCVQRGRVAAVFLIGEGDADEEIEIALEPGMEKDAFKDHRAYRIVLRAVQPYPYSDRTIPPDAYQATVIVLPTSEDVLERELLIREIPISEVEVVVMESYPYQIRLNVKGNLQDACSSPYETTQEREGDRVRVSITSIRPKDAICAQIAPLYEATIVLDGGFESGDYTVIVNNVQKSFTL